MKKIAKYSKPLGVIFFVVICNFIICSCYSKPVDNQNPPAPASSELKNSPELIIGSNTNILSPGIKLIPFSEDFIEIFDVGFKKWVLFFENLKASDYHLCEMMRLFSTDPEHTSAFVPLISYSHGGASFPQEMPLIKTKSGKATNLPKSKFMFIVSEKGFLPGEKVTIRTKNRTTEEYDTISFYPRPIILHDHNGKELAGVELKNIKPTIYVFYVAFNPKNRLIRIQSKSKQENINKLLFQNGSIMSSYIPGVINNKGGVSSLTLTYQNGDTYTLSIPWGEELIPYMLGIK